MHRARWTPIAATDDKRVVFVGAGHVYHRVRQLLARRTERALVYLPFRVCLGDWCSLLIALLVVVTNYLLNLYLSLGTRPRRLVCHALLQVGVAADRLFALEDSADRLCCEVGV